jgi:hypothetical protein
MGPAFVIFGSGGRISPYALRAPVGLGASIPTLRVGAPRLNLLSTQFQGTGVFFW